MHSLSRSPNSPLQVAWPISAAVNLTLVLGFSTAWTGVIRSNPLSSFCTATFYRHGSLPRCLLYAILALLEQVPRAAPKAKNQNAQNQAITAPRTETRPDDPGSGLAGLGACLGLPWPVVS